MAAIARLADNSPTANLLRNSRLFSLPQPLPRPDLSIAFSERIKNSDTATTPYPTHQIIATPDASRSRGDWGLKRPLPMKSTFKSRGIRMHALDTYDEITEFESARDHLMTLKKLQELNVSLIRHSQGNLGRYTYEKKNQAPGAFDEAHDNTAPRALSLEESAREKNGKVTKLPHRWRTRGPELREMPQAQFNNYVEKEVATRKDDFERYLKSYLAKELVKQQCEKTQEQNKLHQFPEKYEQWLNKLSLQEMESYLISKRNDWMAASETNNITPAWIPKMPQKAPSFYQHARKSGLGQQYLNGKLRNIKGIELSDSMTPEENAIMEHSEQGISFIKERVKQVEMAFFKTLLDRWPSWLIHFRNTSGSEPRHRHVIEYFLDLPITVPEASYDNPVLSTHPSAGLSYRRTGRVIQNHPVFGPISGSAPHKARLLPSGPVGRVQDTFLSSQSSCGLAGLVVESTTGNTPFQATNNLGHVKKTYDAQTGIASAPPRGTDKGWVTIDSTTVSNDGRIVMSVKKPVGAIEYIADNKLETDMREDLEDARMPSHKTAPKATPFQLLGMGMVQDGRLVEPLDEEGQKEFGTAESVAVEASKPVKE
jgi:hypothetical protein